MFAHTHRHSCSDRINVALSIVMRFLYTIAAEQIAMPYLCLHELLGNVFITLKKDFGFYTHWA